MAQVQIQLQQVGDTATKAEAGNYEIIIDRPPEKGGGGKGPMGGQVLLMALGAVLQVHCMLLPRSVKSKLQD
jgi:hypothetical protein